MNLAHSAIIVVCFLGSVLNLIQVSRTIAKNDPHRSGRSTDGAMRINFRSVFGHVGISEWPCCIFVPNCVQISSASTEIYISILRNSMWPPSAILDLLGDGPFFGGYPCKNFFTIGLVMVRLQVFAFLRCSRLKVIYMGPKFQFFLIDYQNLGRGDVVYTPERHIIARNDVF